jgi:hypothetical protein
MSGRKTKEARLRATIADVARRPKQVTAAEIQRIVNMLSDFHQTGSRKARHGYLYTVATERFMVNTHTPGDAHVKSYSVQDFLNAMEKLGWYEEEQS